MCVCGRLRVCVRACVLGVFVCVRTRVNVLPQLGRGSHHAHQQRRSTNSLQGISRNISLRLTRLSASASLGGALSENDQVERFGTSMVPFGCSDEACTREKKGGWKRTGGGS